MTESNEILFDKIRALNLSANSFVIFGSGPMAAHGLKVANDIDVLVTKEVYETFVDKEGWINKQGVRDEYLQKDDIDMFHSWGPGEWNTEELIGTAETIDDLPFASLRDVLTWKRMFNREKDKTDINVIEEYLGGHEELDKSS